MTQRKRFPIRVHPWIPLDSEDIKSKIMDKFKDSKAQLVSFMVDYSNLLS